MSKDKNKQGGGFGAGRRFGIGLVVALNVLFAVLIWALLNFLLTKPALRKTFDLSPGAKFSLGGETEALVAQLRKSGDLLEIDTFFESYQGAKDPGGIHARVKSLAYDLIERIRFLGGRQIKVRHNDIYRDIKSSGERVEVTGGQPDTVTLKIGKKTRLIHLIHDMADIDTPDTGGMPGQAQAQFVLRGFKGEQALASALKSMLLEEENLRAYWVKDFFAGDPSDQTAAGYAGLARALMEDGFDNHRISLVTAQEIPANCRLLILLQPRLPIPEREAALIQSYVRRGGSLLMTAGMSRGGRALSQRSLLEPLGLRLGKQQLFNGLPDSTGSAPPRYGDPRCSFLMIEDGWSRVHPVTKSFRQRRMVGAFPQARGLRLAEKMPKGVRGTYLITSNPYTWGEAYVGGVRPDYRPTSEQDLGRQQIAATIVVDGETERKGRIALISAIAFANGDGLIDQHSKFALELCSWLASREARVDVPERYRRTESIKLSPQQVSRVKLLVVWVVPLSFLAFAFFLVYWRRRA
ncbi:MAG: hypothetical protein CSA62_11630 [Planctomycetota bacterium]|nr:MAG: hypothetical protein CSA62_11630 [Planctomycetota bacterium]